MKEQPPKNDSHTLAYIEKSVSLYHGTSASFNSFSLEFAVSSEHAANGHLGIWLAVEKSVACRFGTKCLECEVEFKNIFSITVTELYDINQKCRKLIQSGENPEPENIRAVETKFYAEIRSALLEQGYDGIAVLEFDGRIDMYIALYPEQVFIKSVL